jgi:electron transfer flavoprotein alpha/beta subunit
MFKKRQKSLYTKADINKAYSMGLEKAVVVLERSVLLSSADRWRIIELLKEKIREDKISALKSHL